MSITEPLAHAPIGTVLGLVEHLRDRPQGREDLYKLGGPLGYELDDLLPIVEAAKQLGLVRVDKGDIELTDEGRCLASADEPERKKMLAKHLVRLPLIADVHEALQTRAERRVRKGAFLEMLEERYSPGEAEKQIATAIDWARYGEVFDFDPDNEEFVLPASS